MESGDNFDWAVEKCNKLILEKENTETVPSMDYYRNAPQFQQSEASDNEKEKKSNDNEEINAADTEGEANGCYVEKERKGGNGKTGSIDSKTNHKVTDEGEVLGEPEGKLVPEESRDILCSEAFHVVAEKELAEQSCEEQIPERKKRKLTKQKRKEVKKQHDEEGAEEVHAPRSKKQRTANEKIQQESKTNKKKRQDGKREKNENVVEYKQDRAKENRKKESTYCRNRNIQQKGNRRKLSYSDELKMTKEQKAVQSKERELLNMFPGLIKEVTVRTLHEQDFNLERSISNLLKLTEQKSLREQRIARREEERKKEEIKKKLMKERNANKASEEEEPQTSETTLKDGAEEREVAKSAIVNIATKEKGEQKSGHDELSSTTIMEELRVLVKENKPGEEGKSPTSEVPEAKYQIRWAKRTNSVLRTSMPEDGEKNDTCKPRQSEDAAKPDAPMSIHVNEEGMNNIESMKQTERPRRLAKRRSLLKAVETQKKEDKEVSCAASTTEPERITRSGAVSFGDGTTLAEQIDLRIKDLQGRPHLLKQ